MASSPPPSRPSSETLAPAVQRPPSAVDRTMLFIAKLFAAGLIVLVLVFIVALVAGLGVDDY